jgi:hypothetical protein
VTPEIEKGRPLVITQEDGPDTNSAHITTVRITDAEVIPPEPGSWCVSDLPPRLAKRVTVDQESGCWRVGGYHDPDGYAYYSGEGVHRAAYRLLIRPIPKGHQVDHVRANGCVWRDCCNPAHLEAVTPLVNSRRAASFNASKDQCDYDHEFTEENTYRRPDGHRGCKACIARRSREWKKRNPDHVREAQRRRRRGELATVVSLNSAGFTPEAIESILKAG